MKLWRRNWKSIPCFECALNVLAIDEALEYKRLYHEGNMQMWFRIEIEHNLYVGITLFDTEAISKDGSLEGYQVNDITAEIIDEAAQYLNRDILLQWTGGLHGVIQMEDGKMIIMTMRRISSI